jgi:type IV pilus assembly protein PilN
MIRINLLPQKKGLKTRASAAQAAADSDSDGGSQVWLLFVAGALLLEIVVLIFVYKSKLDQLGLVEHKNDELKGTIGQIDKDMANHELIKTQLKELRDREEAIQKLQGARTGPTAALLELSRMLTTGRGPTVDRDKIEQLRRENPLAVPNPNWDTKRVSLTGYTELDRTVKISGIARDGEDESEFLRRLSVSDLFYDVKLLPATKTTDPVTHLELIKFDISAKVRY